MGDILQYSFFQNAIAGVLIISVAAAVIGTYIIARRLVAISGGVTHACFGGLGLGYFLGINPILMAGVFAVASSLGVEWMAARHRVREDSAIAVVWSIGMAIGVLFVFLTPGYVPELNTFLFGNILTISRGDLWAFSVYTGVLLAFMAWKYREIVAVAFDADFARVAGLRSTLISLTMTVMVAICVVLTIRLVGVMLLMSMLSLPQMTAEVFARRFGRIMALSVGVSVATCLGGLALSTVIDVPCSALIVIVMATVYILARLIATFGKKLASN
ncbi:MAG: metal ABC transporter permease [Bacteroidales bacterium]|nr:metal ABC transporter permease [Bacteroidales bacterium]